MAKIPRGVIDFFMKKLQIPLIFFFGQWGSWVPYPEPLTVVFGAPIDIPRLENPTAADIAMYHSKFIEAEKAIFERFKGRLGYDKDEVLEIRVPSPGGRVSTGGSKSN